MKKAKRLTGLLLALALLLSLAACGGTPASTPPADTGSTPAGSTSTPASTGDGTAAPIRWLTTGDTAAKPLNPDDRIVAVINEKLGIQLTAEIVPEANFEKVNVAMASGDFPDVVTGEYGTSATQGWIDNGMVISLNEYMATRPFMKARNEGDYEWSAIDGEYYGVPFITQFKSANTLIGIRADWLENLDLEYPKTLDDMTAVLTAFTNDDPDGNGQKDTYGFTADQPKNDATKFEWVFFAYGAEHGDYALNENDEAIPFFEGDYFKPGMEYIISLWNAGVIDSELMLNDGPKAEEKFYQGKAGAFMRPFFRNLTRHLNSLQQLFPDADIAYGPPPTGPDGASGLNRQGKGGMLTCITTASEYPDKAADFIEYMLSDEGNDLLRKGIEDVHYTMEGDTWVPVEEERQADSFADNGWAHALAWGSFFWPLESNYLPDGELNKERVQETTELASAAQMPNLVKYKTEAEIRNLSTLNDIYIQAFNDMLTGKVSIDDGLAQLSTDWRSQGGDEVLEEINAAYQASK